ncbi:hypothetical protein P3X46_033018 [Hevea brasiliensis]|uniref:MADS-box domain-containing protein n=1 Tax=Hevea brasiliensis TaxID=3981 RepID=A0ABQ9KGS0_HEVBR|nr:agamous-like MADS-box protein AGL61 [Hevea brasiliensis]KAJ9135893.1 hypothetical protein P3X46_033018 [Hevea brasiliensis]
MAGKQTKGRQKITMKRIENEDDRLIAFSKRRSGIYKKASELVTLCGAEVGVLVFSPAGKPFSFGQPSIESMANRFLENPPPKDNTYPLVEAHRKMRIDELNQQYSEMLSQLEAEKERGNMLKQMMIRGKGRRQQQQQQQSYWWEAPVDELNFQELHQMNFVLEELHSNLCRKINGPFSSRNPIFASNNANLQNDPAASSFPHGCGYGRRYF